MESKVITLEEFIYQKEKDFPYASGELTGLLRNLTLAAKIVNREVNQAGLVDILGSTGTSNIQGEEVKKLDVFANHEFKKAMHVSGMCAGIASEEEDEIVAFDSDAAHKAKYVVMFDPLDGSSNIDVNVSIGTIFSIYRRVTPNGPCTMEDFLQKGTKQVAAGYVVYGSSTMMVYTTGNGVNGFTLDPSIGEFCLSHPNIKSPRNGKIYSVNQGNYLQFDTPVKEYITFCQSTNPEKNKKSYTLRYIASLVADFHRNLLKGGVYLYPTTQEAPGGKLRLLYECNPLAFINEQAGGKASDGFRRILDIEPTQLHQRVPLYIGAADMVDHIESIMQHSKAEANHV